MIHLENIRKVQITIIFSMKRLPTPCDTSRKGGGGVNTELVQEQLQEVETQRHHFIAWKNI